MDKESTGLQRTMTTDKDHFCELCNMVFSSQVVAKSHYDGKVHAKHLRKQGLQPQVTDTYTEVHTFPSLIREPDDADQKSAPLGGIEHILDPTATTATPITEVDLKEPNKYCALCAASFNNPQMALQHYNGRKHQRNQARQDLLKGLGDDVQQANSLICQMCSVQFNSVEMYQAHMQGNKHQIREKKVVDLCQSQQKDYNTFADELADYIQVQKARGITPKAGHVLPVGDAQKEGEEDEKEEEAFNKGDIIEPNKRMPNLPPTSNPPHHSRPGSYFPVGGWRPPYQGPPWPSHPWDYSCPPPVLPGAGSPLFTKPLTNSRRRRKQLSSSSCTTSSSFSSSSSSSSTSDSDDSECRRREKRRIRRSRREGDKKDRDEDSDKEEKRRKRRRRERDNDSEERRREESGESEKESRRKKRKNHGKQRRRENKSREEDFEVKGVERVMDNLIPEDMMDNRKETEVHIQAETNVEQEEGGQDEPAKPKYRKEKKKTKEKVDTRTEEEKLWDDSILGC
ncbi:zinc finger matrin-type protein 1 [Anoplopoma fimbria]|uniref:zinc finger matrin-type protein 1 n=1 Tax=Anoplopoma fimbria TaxID=229290 RepID=UPI0023ED188B|nr:zinc finger matrin-type protein 1 [Anoplopoma fimbria]